MAVRTAPQVALVCCTLRDGALAVLLGTDGARRRGTVPHVPLAATALPDAAADELARRVLGRPPSWRAQVGALPGEAGLDVVYVAALPSDREAPTGYAWQPVARAAAMPAVRAAITHLRDRLDREPVAFRLLPAQFTLSDLQRVYELLLERRLHKASFRRTLLAAHLVEPLDAWRSEGRGRPAQLFRYAPRRRRGVQRAVRFELLG